MPMHNWACICLKSGELCVRRACALLELLNEWLNLSFRLENHKNYGHCNCLCLLLHPFIMTQGETRVIWIASLIWSLSIWPVYSSFICMFASLWMKLPWSFGNSMWDSLFIKSLNYTMEILLRSILFWTWILNWYSRKENKINSI